MEWIRLDNYCQAAEGYRVAAARVGGQWRFSAFAPLQDEDKYQMRLKVQYARGEIVPQRREALGCFEQAEAARAACEAHRGA